VLTQTPWHVFFSYLRRIAYSVFYPTDEAFILVDRPAISDGVHVQRQAPCGDAGNLRRSAHRAVPTSVARRVSSASRAAMPCGVRAM
jgi:hypothetical protein